MTREETLSQIVKMITSGEIPKEIYNKYLSITPIGFMSYDELLNYLKKGKGKETELMSAKEFNENELLFNELYEKTKHCGRVQFINLLMEKEREIKKLEEEYQIIDSKLFFTKYELDMRQKSIDNKLIQQKKFIEYLEDYIDALKQQKETAEGLDIGEEHILMVLEEVLSKYKETIGVKDEKVNC